MEIIRRNPDKKRNPVFDNLTLEIEPVEYEAKETTGRVCTFDSETDPFLKGRTPKPFTCGLYYTDTQEYVDFWGDDCIDQFITYLSITHPEPGELQIFVHNGGNFDFYFLVDYFDAGHKPFIINGRLVRVEICGQEFRDSYTMIPVALGEYDKDAIDYRCMERDFREIFKDTIRKYQKKDCTALGELVTSWLDMFGNKLTMASVALPMLRSYHGFETLTEKLDRDIRPYYFGGRNQCFATGILEGAWKVYDINSSYPDVMRRFNHPISDIPYNEREISDKTHFAHIRAWSLGALPIRAKNGSLEFPIGTYDFYACIHEIKAGLETDTLKIHKVYQSTYFEQEDNFAAFIDHFYDLRMRARNNDDKIRTLFYKLVMNSSYGKFAQDPRKYENWLFNPDKIPTPLYCSNCHNLAVKGEPTVKCESCSSGEFSAFGWYLHTQREGISIYAAPQRIRHGNFFNVATAASITSAARAQLLRGIQAATRPVYCDTDSIICEHLESTPTNGITLDAEQLGAWDMEKHGDTCAIAGKKLYAIFDGGIDNAHCVKKASKGVKLTPEEILRVARGEVIEYAHPVPKFNLNGHTLFTTRNIRATA
jgi:hypothetical protein